MRPPPDVHGQGGKKRGEGADARLDACGGGEVREQKRKDEMKYLKLLDGNIFIKGDQAAFIGATKSEKDWATLGKHWLGKYVNHARNTDLIFRRPLLAKKKSKKRKGKK